MNYMYQKIRMYKEAIIANIDPQDWRKWNPSQRSSVLTKLTEEIFSGMKDDIFAKALKVVCADAGYRHPVDDDRLSEMIRFVELAERYARNWSFV
jgi:fibrillarin-like rRNA methylase